MANWGARGASGPGASEGDADSRESWTGQAFYLGQWMVVPERNQVTSEQATRTIEPKLMEVLVYLSHQAPRVVSPDELIEACWPGRFISDNPLHKCIAQLRKALGDSARSPRYIRTVPRRGYSVVASVNPVRREDSEPAAIHWVEGSPFRGPAAYKGVHRPIFFGRHRATMEVGALLESARSSSFPCVLVTGPGGVGKTSLVQAGVLPVLEEAFARGEGTLRPHGAWTVPSDPEESALQSLGRWLIDRGLLVDSAPDALERLLERPEALAHALAPPEEGTMPVLFLDQLERLVRRDRVDAGATDLFFRALVAIVEQGKLVVLGAVRDEFHDEAGRCDPLRTIEAQSARYELAAPDTYELHEIITGPARAAGLRFDLDGETGKPLDQLLLGEARFAGNALPVISETLDYLYRHRSRDNVLLSSAYAERGGIRGALIERGESTLAGLPKPTRDAFPGLLRKLVRVPSAAEGGATCQSAELADLSDSEGDLALALVEAGLILVDRVGNATRVELVHDTILQHWGRVRTWIADNRTMLLAAAEVKWRTARWLDDGSPRSMLLPPGALLEQAHRLADRQAGELGQEELRYIRCSLRGARRHRWLRAGVASLLGVSLLLSLMMTWRYQAANQALDETNKRAERLISFMMTDLKSRLEPLARLDLLDLVGRQVIDYYAAYEEPPASEAALMHGVSALNTVGEVYVRRGALEAALDSFRNSRRLLDGWSGPEWTRHETRLLDAHTAYWTGLVHFRRGDMARAESRWMAYLDIASRYAERFEDLSAWKLEQSYALNNLGTLEQAAGDAEAAAGYFRASAELKEALRQQAPDNPLFLAELADTLSWQASAVQSLGRPEESLALSQRSLEMSARLTELDEDNWNWWHRLALARYRHALKLFDFGRVGAARTELERTLPIYERLYEHESGRVDWNREFVNSLLLHSRTLRHESRAEEATAELNRARRIHEALGAEASERPWVAIQAFALDIEYALLLSDLGEARAATMHLQQSLDRSADAAWIERNEGAALRVRAQIHLGDLYGQTAGRPQSERIWAEAQRQLEILLSQAPDEPRLLAAHAAILDRLGQTEQSARTRERILRLGHAAPDLFTPQGASNGH
jgi:DNA-binding winged helix-turn-helix (wHTH) protein/tetratricopeptide (TPR) repeat protein